MTRRDKLYTQIVNNPKNVNFEDIDRLLKQNGFTCRQPSGGSTIIFIITKAIYVKEAINLINKTKEER